MNNVNLNDTSRDIFDLTDVEGVGYSTVCRIRDHQAYDSVEDLLGVPGIGESTFENIKPHVFVDASRRTHEEALREAEKPWGIWNWHSKESAFIDADALHLCERKYGNKWEVQHEDCNNERTRHHYVFDAEEEARVAFRRCREALEQGDPIGDPFADWKEPDTPDATVKDATSEYKKADSWDLSAIMSRGHEIAKSLSNERPYTNRLSDGMTRAWAEAKDEQQSDEGVGEDAEEWKTNDEEEKDRSEEIRYHAAQISDGTGRLQTTAITTDDAKERIGMMPGVEAELDEDGWIVTVEWRGNELLNRRVETYEDAAEFCYETAWPIANRRGLLDQAALQIGIDRTMYRFRGTKSNCSGPSHNDQEDYVFVEADSKEILHIDAYETEGLPGAIRSLHAAGVTQDNVEVWVAESSCWLEVNEPNPPQPGDYLHTCDTRALKRYDGQGSQKNESRDNGRTRPRCFRSGSDRSRERSDSQRDRTRSGNRRQRSRR